jgi:hypothetical protein
VLRKIAPIVAAVGVGIVGTSRFGFDDLAKLNEVSLHREPAVAMATAARARDALAFLDLVGSVERPALRLCPAKVVHGGLQGGEGSASRQGCGGIEVIKQRCLGRVLPAARRGAGFGFGDVVPDGNKSAPDGAT